MIGTQVIDLTGILVPLHLGVTEEERREAQVIRVSASLTLRNDRPFTPESRLDDTVDYSELIRYLLHTLPGQGPIVLIETVGDLVAAHCLSVSDRVEMVRVTVEKPSVLGSNGMVSVTLTRTRRA